MTDRNYQALRSAAKFEAFVDRLIANGKPIGFDIEASYNAPSFIDKGALLQFHPTWFLTGFSFTNSLNWSIYVPVAHADGNNVDDIIVMGRALWRLLNSGLIVAHNISYELKGTRRWFKENLWDDPVVGEEVRAQDGLWKGLADSQLLVWLSAEYNPVTIGKDLKSVTKAAFGHEMVHFEDLFRVEGKRPARDKRFHLLDSTDRRVIEYACEDALWCLALYFKHIEAWENHVIYKTEMALLPVLIDMEIEGMYLDWGQIAKKAAEVDQFRQLMNEDILKELSERLGETININLGSVKQLSEILYERMGLPVKERSKKTNEPSTSESALRAIAKTDPVINQILLLRELNKLYGSYLHKYETELNYGGNNRAFPNHNSMGALTGRFSVDHVSYQQWPKPYHYELAHNNRTFDLNFRDLLIAPDEYRIVGYDFSQVELRVLAGVANETALLEAFKSGVDIHKATASNMMGIPIEEVTKKQRAVGKTLNFAVVYGSGAENIADMLTSPDAPVTTEDAEEMLRKYFAAFSKLKGWMDKKVIEGREQGYVETPFGRKFTVWEYQSSNGYIRSKGDRMCVNAPIQGGAADYMKIGMVRVNKAIRKAEAEGRIPVGGVRLIMTIHDALEFYVHETVATQTVIDIVQPAVTFPVKGFPEIRADWHEGYQWGAVAEIDLDENKQITGYSLEYELPWLKEAHEWHGATLHEVLDQYYDWEWGFFGESAPYYAKRNPEFTLKGEPRHALAEKDVPPQSPTQPGPPPEVGDPAPEPAAPWEDHPDDSAPKTSNRISLTSNEETVDDLAELAEEEKKNFDAELPEWAASEEFRDAIQSEPKHVVITISSMPSPDQFANFKAFLAEHTGVDTVTLSTPEGDLPLRTKHSIPESEQPVVSRILGGADIRSEAIEVSADIMEGVL